MPTTVEKRAVLELGHSLPRKARRISEARPPRPPEAVRELCHDLRGPAATIMALAAAAAVESDMPASAHARLSQIVDEARRISALCRDVLEAPSQNSVVWMDELAAGIAEPAGLAAGVAVDLRLARTFVVGNAHALGRALWNLIDNAVRAAEPGGRIIVEVRDECPMVRVVVSDSGPGFGASKGGVAGLGLRIAGRVVAEHGGELTVMPHGELGGASVVLLLPSSDRYPVARPS